MNCALGCWGRTKPKPRGQWFDFLLHKHFLIWKRSNVACSGGGGHLYVIWPHKEGAADSQRWSNRGQRAYKINFPWRKASVVPGMEFACLNFFSCLWLNGSWKKRTVWDTVVTRTLCFNRFVFRRGGVADRPSQPQSPSFTADKRGLQKTSLW